MRCVIRLAAEAAVVSLITNEAYRQHGSPLAGWFVGGCTDPDYQDPACRQSCTGDGQTWIQYNYTSQLWHCCGDNGCTGTPTSETFQAAPPEQFEAVPSGPQSSTASPAPTNGTSNEAETSQPPAPSSELSSGAKAGIGVAAAVAGIAIAVAIAFFVLWRKAKKASASQSPQNRWQQEQGMAQQPQQAYAHYDSQPANYYQKPPEEMALNQQYTPELAGETGGGRK